MTADADWQVTLWTYPYPSHGQRQLSSWAAAGLWMTRVVSAAYIPYWERLLSPVIVEGNRTLTPVAILTTPLEVSLQLTFGTAVPSDWQTGGMSAYTAPTCTSSCLHRRHERTNRCRSTHLSCHAAQDPLLLRVARGEGVITPAQLVVPSSFFGAIQYIRYDIRACTSKMGSFVQRRKGHRCG